MSKEMREQVKNYKQFLNEDIEYDDLGFIKPDSVGVVSFDEAKKSNNKMYTEKINYFYTKNGGLMKTNRYDTIQSLGLYNCYPALSRERYYELMDNF